MQIMYDGDRQYTHFNLPEKSCIDGTIWSCRVLFSGEERDIAEAWMENLRNSIREKTPLKKLTYCYPFVVITYTITSVVVTVEATCLPTELEDNIMRAFYSLALELEKELSVGYTSNLAECIGRLK